MRKTVKTSKTTSAVPEVKTIKSVKSVPASAKKTAQAIPAIQAPIAAQPVAPAVKPVVAVAPAVASKNVPTVIDVKLDVGFGNAVYLRGEGAGLAWDHGTPLTNVDASTWRWSSQLRSPITFKVLINDQVWSAGSDLTARPGETIELVPSF